MEVHVQTPGARGTMDNKEMKSEEEEAVVSVGEEKEARVSDNRHYNSRSLCRCPLVQDWGRHLLLTPLNCSCICQHVLNVPKETFNQYLYRFFSICVVLSLIRLKYESGSLPHMDLRGLVEFSLFIVLYFVILAAFVTLEKMTKIRIKIMKCATPTLSGTIQQV